MRMFHYVVMMWLSDVPSEHDKRPRAIKNKIVCNNLKQANDVCSAMNMVDSGERAEVCVQYYIPNVGNAIIPYDSFEEFVRYANDAGEQVNKDYRELHYKPKAVAAE